MTSAIVTQTHGLICGLCANWASHAHGDGFYCTEHYDALPDARDDLCVSCGEPLTNGSRGISVPDYGRALCGACADEVDAERLAGAS